MSQKKLNPKEALNTIENRQRKELVEQGKRPFLLLEEGETKITVDENVPLREEEGDYGIKTIIRVKQGTEEFDLSASTSLAKKIFKALVAGHNPMTIIRVGQDKQTRYSIKEMSRKKV